MIEIILIALIVCFVVIGIDTLSSYFVYGGFLPNNEINQFLDNHLEGYYLNYFDNSILSNNDMRMPYISFTPFIGLFSKYHVSDYGQIWRWSAATKRIDEKLRELQVKVPEKKLNEL